MARNRGRRSSGGMSRRSFSRGGRYRRGRRRAIGRGTYIRSLISRRFR